MSMAKYDVISALETLERVLREVRLLDPSLIDSLAVKAGVMSSDVVEAESNLTQCIEHIIESMVDVDGAPTLDIKDNRDHFEALGTSDCFDTNLGHKNRILGN